MDLLRHCHGAAAAAEMIQHLHSASQQHRDEQPGLKGQLALFSWLGGGGVLFGF